MTFASAALADALRRLRDAGVSLEGASDHGVSQALYLRDPDGNGVELYWERPEDQWTRGDHGQLASSPDRRTCEPYWMKPAPNRRSLHDAPGLTIGACGAPTPVARLRLWRRPRHKANSHFRQGPSAGRIARMVTEQILREHIGHKPFRPFRITLHDGRTLSVTQRNQAATLKRRMVVGLGNDQLQWIWHKEIARVEALTSQMT